MSTLDSYVLLHLPVLPGKSPRRKLKRTIVNSSFSEMPQIVMTSVERGNIPLEKFCFIV